MKIKNNTGFGLRKRYLNLNCNEFDERNGFKRFKCRGSITLIYNFLTYD